MKFFGLTKVSLNDSFGKKKKTDQEWLKDQIDGITGVFDLQTIEHNDRCVPGTPVILDALWSMNADDLEHLKSIQKKLKEQR